MLKKDSKLLNFFKVVYSILSISGGILLYTVAIKIGDYYKKTGQCSSNQSIIKISCLATKTGDKLFTNIKNLGDIFPGSRLISKGSKERFKNQKEGFQFNYPKNSNIVEGYILLSKYDPNLYIPKIELWDLNAQELIHSWDIDIDKLKDEVKLPTSVLGALRLLHPLILEDGSIITHTQPEFFNTPLLKFDNCGKLVKQISGNYGFHHSIEIDKKGDIIVPTTTTNKTETFYKNYIDFKKDKNLPYRNEAIAILDNNLNIKEIIPLDEIFHSIGLLNDVNSPTQKFTNDPYHLNDIHPHINEFGETIYYLSMRHYGLVAYNKTKKKVDWVIKGLTDLQHDITPINFLKNSVSIFDNGARRNTPLGEFKGNTIVKLTFPFKNDDETMFLLGRNLDKQGVSVNVIDFSTLPKEEIPDSQTEGRGRFLNNKNIFIEETNHGRAFQYDVKNEKFMWTYLNKSASGNTYSLGWSRYYEKLPDRLNLKEIKRCKK